MKRKKKAASAEGWLDPQKTKKLLIAAGILVTLGILALSLCVQYEVLTNDAAMSIGWVVLSIVGLLLLVDTLAQDRTTKYVRLTGIVVVLIYVFYRYI